MVSTESQVYSFSVSVSIAAMMYLRTTPFWYSSGAGLQLNIMEFESITSPVTSVGEPLGPNETLLCHCSGKSKKRTILEKLN